MVEFSGGQEEGTWEGNAMQGCVPEVRVINQELREVVGREVPAWVWKWDEVRRGRRGGRGRGGGQVAGQLTADVLS